MSFVTPYSCFASCTICYLHSRLSDSSLLSIFVLCTLSSTISSFYQPYVLYSFLHTVLWLQLSQSSFSASHNVNNPGCWSLLLTVAFYHTCLVQSSFSVLHWVTTLLFLLLRTFLCSILDPSSLLHTSLFSCCSATFSLSHTLFCRLYSFYLTLSFLQTQFHTLRILLIISASSTQTLQSYYFKAISFQSSTLLISL